MRLIYSLLFFLLTISGSAWGERFQSKVYQIDKSKKPGLPHIVKMENGRVAFLDPSDVTTFNALKNSQSDRNTLELEVSSEYDLLSVYTVNFGNGPQSREVTHDNEENNIPMSYEPTVLSNISAARSVFSRMKLRWQNESQCYNRAHVWAFEEFNRSSLKSVKLFLFFTSRYIRNYRYKWWFHVSPMTMVKEGNSINSLVLDRRYTTGPHHVKNWTDIFIYSKRNCPVVSKYSDYNNNQEKEDCFLIPTTQYFWQPRDIDNHERTGNEKNQFIKSEVDWAYTEAF